MAYPKAYYMREINASARDSGITFQETGLSQDIVLTISCPRAIIKNTALLSRAPPLDRGRQNKIRANAAYYSEVSNLQRTKSRLPL